MRRPAFVFLIAWGLHLAAFAQDLPGPLSVAQSQLRATGVAPPRAAKMRVTSDLVLVPVFVTDNADRLITGLDHDRFKLFDDGVEQDIKHFASEDAPVSLVLVVDTSASMGRKLQVSRLAVADFLKESNPEDEFALVTFADRVRLVTPFTAEPEGILSSLLFTQSRGTTALIDAVYRALDETKHARHARKAILVISDGGDNSSRYTTSELKQRVREADVQIYSLGILESDFGRTPEEADGPALLGQIATLSGGKLFEVVHVGSLTGLARQVGSALRNQYVLGYYPSTPKQDDRYHRIKVQVQQPKGQPKLRANYRAGYFSPSQ